MASLGYHHKNLLYSEYQNINAGIFTILSNIIVKYFNIEGLYINILSKIYMRFILTKTLD